MRDSLGHLVCNLCDEPLRGDWAYTCRRTQKDGRRRVEHYHADCVTQRVGFDPSGRSPRSLDDLRVELRPGDPYEVITLDIDRGFETRTLTFERIGDDEDDRVFRDGEGGKVVIEVRKIRALASV